MQLTVEVRLKIFLVRFLPRERRRGLHLANARMRGAAFRRVGEQRDARARAEQVSRKLRRGHGNVGKLFHIRLGNHAAVREEHHALFAEARVLDFHDHAARRGGGLRRDLDDLKQRAQRAAHRFARAGDHAIGLVHGDHHRAKVIRILHRLARLLDLDALGAADEFIALREALAFLAVFGVEDADAFERDAEFLGELLNFRAVAEQDGRAELERIELARGLKDARLGAFREHEPLRMPLQFFDDGGDETHGAEW